MCAHVCVRACVCSRMFTPQWAEYVLFASLLVCVCIIFSIMAYFYTYINPDEIEAQFSKYDPNDNEKKKMDTKCASDEEKTNPNEIKQTKIWTTHTAWMLQGKKIITDF